MKDICWFIERHGNSLQPRYEVHSIVLTEQVVLPMKADFAVSLQDCSTSYSKKAEVNQVVIAGRADQTVDLTLVSSCQKEDILV